MTQYVITGGRALRGTVIAGGSKNALLPILSATLLYGGRCEIHRAPHLSDVENTLEILQYLGAQVHFCGDVITVDTASVCRCDVPAEYTARCRASVCFLSPLLVRFGRCSLAYPGGCRIGKRPINYHLGVLRALGNFEIREHEGGVDVQGHFTGGTCKLPYPSVGATECALMAAAFCPTPCIIQGGALEPEVEDLRHFLNACGAQLSRRDHEAGTVCSRPVSFRMHEAPLMYSVIPDRIESGTFALAAAATRGEVLIRGCRPEDMEATIRLLVACGVTVQNKGQSLYVNARGRRLSACPLLTAYPYPAFPTDLQAPACAFLATCPGRSVVLDTVFPERYAHVRELRKFGARVSCVPTPGGERYALLEGGPLYGTQAVSTDLRAGAALLIAGLCARGTSIILDDGYIARGYESVNDKFRLLGGRIQVKNE